MTLYWSNILYNQKKSDYWTFELSKFLYKENMCHDLSSFLINVYIKYNKCCEFYFH